MFVWTEEVTQLAVSLWSDGKSAKHIGDTINVSRHAVIGKMHRLGVLRNPGNRPADVPPRPPRA